MENPTYPEEDLNRGLRLLSLLGSFWSELFGDREKLRGHLQSSGHEQGRTHLEFLETVACLSRFTVPVFHREDWHLLIFKKSDAENTPSTYREGDLVYGPQTGSVPERAAGFIQTYGGRDRADEVKAPLPSSLSDLPWNLQNLVMNPSLILTRGVDFAVERRATGKVLAFKDDPFANPLIPRRQVVDESGNQVDEEIALWAYGGQFDLNYVYVQFGYVLGLRLDSGQFYKDLLNAWWNQYLEGFSVLHLQAFMSALSGAPIIVDPTETVEVVRDEGDRKLVVTNRRSYEVPSGGNVVVAVGDVLHAGDPLSDAFRVIELGGASPDLSFFQSAAFGNNFLSGRRIAELGFRNALVSVVYGGVDAEGRTVATFEVNGFPGDVEAFWEEVQRRGRESGKTLANLLDVRDHPTDEPGPDSLPRTINPLQFVFENFLKNNLFVLLARQAAFASGAPGISLFRCLRDSIPPHISYLVFVEVEVPLEIVDLGAPGGENEFGAEDAVGKFTAANPLMDEAYEGSSLPPGDYPTYADVAVSVRPVSVTCR